MLKYWFNRLFKPDQAHAERLERNRNRAVRHFASLATTVLSISEDKRGTRKYFRDGSLTLAAWHDNDSMLFVSVAYEDASVLQVRAKRTGGRPSRKEPHFVNDLNGMPYAVDTFSIQRGRVWEESLQTNYLRVCRTRGKRPLSMPYSLRSSRADAEKVPDKAAAEAQADSLIRRLKGKARSDGPE